jgi:cytidine deaminase
MNDEELIAEARNARSNAYSPYSTFAVGAALRCKDGVVFRGCNVENISYGLTLCAERVAIGAAISEGAREFDAIAIISDSLEPVVPCGACRQVLAEFAPGLRVISSTLAGVTAEFDLAVLLPVPKQGILR